MVPRIFYAKFDRSDGGVIMEFTIMMCHVLVLLFQCAMLFKMVSIMDVMSCGSRALCKVGVDGSSKSTGFSPDSIKFISGQLANSVHRDGQNNQVQP